MSSMGFDEMARNNGLNIIKAPVGDRYVLEKMLEEALYSAVSNRGM